MNGELHQMLLITALGNGYLIHANDAVSKELEQTDTMIVRFQSGDQLLIWSEWLEQLRAEQYQRFMLVHITEEDASTASWQNSGFMGGGARHGIAALATAGHTIWIPEWKIDRHPTRSRWQVTYRPYPYSGSQQAGHAFVPLAEMTSQLRKALEQVATLAEEIGEAFWKTNFFDPALQLLDGDKTKTAKYAFELPPVYSEEAWRLLNAVYKSWVFGGMGSWNDSTPGMAYEHGKGAEYERYSAELYEALLQSARTAVNSVVF
ncbi:hypothetical protein [Paenibacillus kandeliae]|uniref:hypothetical protein n=1 Tax=Paenibacillus kandeliae TaxID=3231269 RepID=UPI00345B140B